MSRVLVAAGLTAALIAAAPGANAIPLASRPASLVDAIVVLKAQADLTTLPSLRRAARLAAVEKRLRAKAKRTQQGVLSLLAARRDQHLVTRVQPLWIANEVAISAAPSVLSELSMRPDVAAIQPELTVQAPNGAPAPTSDAADVEPNISRINAPAMWARGYRGQGVVVANMDTGVDASQPDLAAKWRGGTNSWYDPNGQHPTTPTDVNGHGTWTMGVMVGGDAGGTSVGVAPDAKWIAVKIFNDSGVATSTNIHLGFQWLLDPDGNPATADAPNVVNNSWSMTVAGCDTSFQTDLRNLRAAGILPVFAAGNDGPAAGSVPSPANLPEAFAVGGTDNSDALDPYSSRGPSACPGAVAPDLTAPDTSIRTTDLYGDYTVQTGTSLAAPHVTGALALLLGAFPNLSADRQEAALEDGAVDLGPPGVDNDYGYGRTDVDAAYGWLATAPDYAVAASPASVTAAPGATANYTVALSASNGFAADVSLALSGLSAADATWSFSPAVVSGGSGESTLSLTPADTISPGNYPLVVTATSGELVHTAIVTLVVPSPPDFTITASPTSQSAVAGASTTFEVTVSAVNGFTGNVDLSLTGLDPAIGTGTFTPDTIAVAGTAQLTIVTDASAPNDSYAFTVSGTDGTITHTAGLTLTVTPPPDFNLSATPNSATVNAGQAATYSVSVGALNGFSATVDLSETGLPASVGAATISPPAMAGSGTAQLKVQTATSAPSGTYPMTVTGVSGSLTHSTSVTLVVAERDFIISANPTTATVARGQTASYTIKVTPTGGFAGKVTLSVSGLPAGTTASFSVNPVSAGGSSTLRLRTKSTTPRGTFTVKLAGASGSIKHSLGLTLIVK